MKRILLTGLISLFTLNGMAQNRVFPEHHLSFRIGAAIPTGDFASKDGRNYYAGFAQTGVSAAADYTSFYTENLGFGATGGITRNGFDHASMNQQLGTRLIAGSGWRTTFFLANLVGGLPLGPDFLTYLKAGGGFTLNTYPDFQTSSVGSSSGVKDPKIKSESLAYGLGGGFKWHSDNTGVGFDFLYLAANPTFSRYSTSYKQPMKSLNCTFNISFNL